MNSTNRTYSVPTAHWSPADLDKLKGYLESKQFKRPVSVGIDEAHGHDESVVSFLGPDGLVITAPLPQFEWDGFRSPVSATYSASTTQQIHAQEQAAKKLEALAAMIEEQKAKEFAMQYQKIVDQIKAQESNLGQPPAKPKPVPSAPLLDFSKSRQIGGE